MWLLRVNSSISENLLYFSSYLIITFALVSVPPPGFKVKSSSWHLFLSNFISGQMTLPNSFYRLWERVCALSPEEPWCVYQTHLDLWRPYLNVPQIRLSHQAHVDLQKLPSARRSQALSRWFTSISADMVSPHFCHPLSLPQASPSNQDYLITERMLGHTLPHLWSSLYVTEMAVTWSCSGQATLPLSQGLFYVPKWP